MRLVLKLCIAAYSLIVLYSIPWILFPWANEGLVRWMAAINIFEAMSIIGMLWFIHTVLLAEESKPESTEQPNVKVFKARK